MSKDKNRKGGRVAGDYGCGLTQIKVEKPVDPATAAAIEARRKVDALRAAGMQLPVGTAAKLAEKTLRPDSMGGQPVERILTTQQKPECSQRQHLTRQVPVLTIAAAGIARRQAEKARMTGFRLNMMSVE